MKQIRQSEEGFGIVEVLIAGALAVGVAFAMASMLGQMSKSSRKLETSLDLSGIKARTIEAVSCANTVAANPDCTTKGGYIALIDQRGNEFVAAQGTGMGSLFVRARCIAGATGGIEVRAAKLTAAGLSAPNAAKFDFQSPKAEWFNTDEVASNLKYDWSHPKALILGLKTTGDERICREYFSGTVSSDVVRCANASDVMQGYNPATKTAVCVAGADITRVKSIKCPAGQYLEGIVDNSPVCKTLPAASTTTTTTTSTSSSTSSTSLTWTNMGDQCNSNSANLPQCPVYSNVQGTSCSSLNALCKSQFINDVSLCGGMAVCDPNRDGVLDYNCRRVFKCTP